MEDRLRIYPQNHAKSRTRQHIHGTAYGTMSLLAASEYLRRRVIARSEAERSEVPARRERRSTPLYNACARAGGYQIHNLKYNDGWQPFGRRPKGWPYCHPPLACPEANRRDAGSNSKLFLSPRPVCPEVIKGSYVGQAILDTNWPSAGRERILNPVFYRQKGRLATI